MKRYLFVIYCLVYMFSVTPVAAQRRISGESKPMWIRPDEKAVPVSLKNSRSNEFVNIDSLPIEASVRPYSVAIVIGVENYSYFPPAPHATRDAELISRYFKTLFGVERVYLYKNEEVLGFFFSNLFDSEEGEIRRVIKDNLTDLYVFYSGHGMPSKNGEESFMLPADTKIKHYEWQGFSLNTLFTQLAALQTKSTTVFIDACFSGMGKFSHSQSPVNLSGTKGIKVKPILDKPWIHNSKFRVFTSSTENQASLTLDETRTGLFSYVLMAGLQGHADLNKDGSISAGELNSYIVRNVSEMSKGIYKEQTPCFYGNDSEILIENVGR